MDNLTEREKLYFKVFQHDYWAESATTLAEKDDLDQKRAVLLEQAQALPAISVAPLVWDGVRKDYAEGFQCSCGIDANDAWFCNELTRAVDGSPKELDKNYVGLKAWCEAQYQEHCASIIKEMEGKDND